MNNLKKYSVIVFLTLILHSTHGQGNLPIAAKIENAKSQNNIWKPINKIYSIQEDTCFVTNAKNSRLFTINKNELNHILKESPKLMCLALPWNHKGKEISLELLLNENYNEFSIKNIESKVLHYKGIVKNSENKSIVALSFYENQLMGFISINGERIINIGKFKDNETHAITQLEQKEQPILSLTEKQKINPILNDIYSKLNINSSKQSNILSNKGKSGGNHLSLNITADADLYSYFDNDINQINTYISGLLNQVAVLYENENIFLQVVAINIVSGDEQYVVTDYKYKPVVEKFARNNTDFIGNVAILLKHTNELPPYDAMGFANGIGGLCVSGESDLSPHCVVAINPGSETVPSFSSQAWGVAHELAHVLGSRHTHACVWNGNNTAIDGCGTCMEEAIWTDDCTSETCCTGCEDPGLPTEGGTIMSYCSYTDVGVDFTLGFGNQPGTVIREVLAINSDCVSCDLELVSETLQLNSTINACSVFIEDLVINPSSTITINYSGDVVINGPLYIDKKSIFKLKNQ